MDNSMFLDGVLLLVQIVESPLHLLVLIKFKIESTLALSQDLHPPES